MLKRVSTGFVEVKEDIERGFRGGFAGGARMCGGLFRKSTETGMGVMRPAEREERENE